MRPFAVFVIAFVLVAPARALEVESELTVGPDFLHRTTDVDVELCDGKLGLGGGYTMASDLHDVRFGAQAKVAAHVRGWTAALGGSWGPSQAGRGWATLEPAGSFRVELERVTIEGELALTLRRADAALRRRTFPLGQAQLRAELSAEIDERWQLALAGLRSFYDVDLSRRSLRGTDAGLSVSMAGKPELWAVAARGGRRIGARVGVEVGLAWVVFADGRGEALVPRLALRTGPWRGFSVEASAELVAGVARATGDPLRALGGLKLGFEK